MLSAEGVGFEPTRRFRPPVFKTGSIGHSDSPPWNGYESIGAPPTLRFVSDAGVQTRATVTNGSGSG